MLPSCEMTLYDFFLLICVLFLIKKLDGMDGSIPCSYGRVLPPSRSAGIYEVKLLGYFTHISLSDCN